MALDAGSVYATLGGRFVPSGFAQFDAAVKRAAVNAGQAEAASRRSAGTMAAMGKAARVAGTAGVAVLAYGLTKSVKAAVDFEQAMSEVQAVTKATPKDMKRMADAAKTLGASTGVGAKKAAGALAELAKGGLSTKQTIGALAGTIAMSQAGSMDLSTAATTVAQALNLFALRGSDASHVADAFATAANKTTADVGFFAQGLAQGGAAAKAAGLSFDQTTAALETLAANGFKSGSDAGTSLKTAFIQMVKPSKQAAEKAKELGIEFFTQSGRMKSLTSISAMLRDKLGGLTREQRLNAAATLVGTDGMRALMALYDQGPAKVARFQKGLAAQGTATDVAKTKMDNFAGNVQKLKSNMETLGINIGEKLVPKLNDAAESLNRFLSDYNAQKPDTTGGKFGEIMDWVGKVAHYGGWGVITDKLIPRLSSALRLLTGNTEMPHISLTADLVDEASPAIERIRAKRLEPKIQKILGDSIDAQAKVDALKALGIPDKVARLIVQEDGLDEAIAALGRVPHHIGVTAELKDEVTSKLTNIINKPLQDKVTTILADDTDVKTKVARLKAWGFSGPAANFIARTNSVNAAVAAIKGQSLSVPVKYIPQVMKPTLPGALPSGKRGRASGRGPGNAEVALVGEGRGPEWVGNPDTGFRQVAGAQLAMLGPADYVIPTERAHRGRALDLIASAFGLEGYKKGRDPYKKLRKGGKGKTRNRFVPEKVYAFHSPDWFDQEVARLEGVAGDKNKDGKLTAKAKKAKRELVTMRRLAAAAKRYAGQINTAETEADIQSDLMRKADGEDDQAAYNAAFSSRKKQLGKAIGLLKRALKLHPKGGWNQKIRQELAGLGAQLAEMPAEPDSVLADEGVTTYTKAEQDVLDRLDSDLAMAALTDTVEGAGEDRDVLTRKVQFLQGLLSDGTHTSSTAIRDIATELKSTQDALKGLVSATPEKTADQQAIEEQARNRERIAAQNANVDRLLGAVFGSGGSGALASTQVVFQSYVPPSPQQARQLADYTVGGIAYQGGRQASSTTVGV